MGTENLKEPLTTSAGSGKFFRQIKRKAQRRCFCLRRTFCEIRRKKIWRPDCEGLPDIPIIPILICAVACLFIFHPFAAPGGAYEYIEITVLPGDTVWAISGGFTAAGEDVRAVVDRVYKQNKLDADKVIQPGQKIVVPALKAPASEKIAFAGPGASAP